MQPALIPCGTAGFQRTYEELKLTLGKYAKKLSVSFQRTYEELKHNNIPLYAYDIVGFQRTYEELKQNFSRSTNTIKVAVFSVPTRN